MILLSLLRHPSSSVFLFLSDVDLNGYATWDNGICSEVNVMEDIMRVGGLCYGWDCVDFLLDINDSSWARGDKWHFFLDCVFFNFPEFEFFNFLYGERNEDLGGVVLPELNYVWLIDGDFVWDLLPLGLFESALNVVWLLLVLSDSNLGGDDIWDLLDDGVINSLGALIWYGDFFLDWDFVVDGVWNSFCGDIGDVVADFIWHLSAGGVWDLDLLFVWDLSFDGVWNLSFDFSWLESLDFVLFGNILSLSNLVWDLFDGNNWDLLGDLVFFGLVFSHSVDVCVIR